jgi:hypothetical protein
LHALHHCGVEEGELARRKLALTGGESWETLHAGRALRPIVGLISIEVRHGIKYDELNRG